MGVLVFAATAVPTAGIPLWVTVLGIGLAAFVVPAFQYLSTRSQTKAGSRVVASTAHLSETTALSNTIATLAAENKRLADRNTILEGYIDGLTAELGQEPTRDQLLRSVQKLRDQVKGLGERPVNGPSPVIAAPKPPE